MKTSKTSKIFFVIISSFIFVFALNLLLAGSFIDPILGLMKGDISALMQFDVSRFVNVAGALAAETGVLSGAFFVVTKKIFR